MYVAADVVDDCGGAGGCRAVKAARAWSRVGEVSLIVDQYLALLSDSGVGLRASSPLNQGDEVRAKRVRLLQGRRHAAAKDAGFLDGFCECEAHHLTKVEAGNKVLKWLKLGLRMALEELRVPARERQDGVSEHAKLRVNDDMSRDAEPALWRRVGTELAGA